MSMSRFDKMKEEKQNSQNDTCGRDLTNKRKTKGRLVVVVEWRQRANPLLSNYSLITFETQMKTILNLR